MLNKIFVMGRLTSDVELRRTAAGTPVTSFTLAVKRDGKEDATDFIDVVAWNGTAEFANRYFGKGRMMLVCGRLQIREWQDKQGNKRKSAEVIASDVYFADSKKESKGKNFTEIPDDGDTLPF